MGHFSLSPGLLGTGLHKLPSASQPAGFSGPSTGQDPQEMPLTLTFQLRRATPALSKDPECLRQNRPLPCPRHPLRGPPWESGDPRNLPLKALGNVSGVRRKHGLKIKLPCPSCPGTGWKMCLPGRAWGWAETVSRD